MGPELPVVVVDVVFEQGPRDALGHGRIDGGEAAGAERRRRVVAVRER